MLNAAEIGRGVQGALGFLWRDPGALLAFDNTMEACLRSFRLMAVTAPLYVIYALIRYADLAVAIDTFELIAIETMSYVVNWLLYPVIFYEIARHRGWVDRYPRYIAALNWSNLPQYIMLLVAQSIASLVPSLATPLALALQVVLFYWFMMVTRLGLGVSWLHASLLMVVSYVPSFFVSYLVSRFLGIGVAGG